MAEQKNFLDINGLQYLWNKIIAKLSHKVDDVQINGTSITNNGVADIPIGGNDLGVVKVNQTSGVGIASDGTLAVMKASNTAYKRGVDNSQVVTPSGQHMSAFYGLAKASGDSTQSNSSNSVGIYTDDAKASIKSMLGVTDPVVDDVQINGASILQDGVANIPVASANTPGVVEIYPTYGVGIINNKLMINSASSEDIKQGNISTKPISAYKQHESVFYGLAKASGDTTQSSNSNSIGTYTNEAKASIQTMLDVPSNSDLDTKVDKSAIDNAGITNKTYTELFDGEFTVTTATTEGYTKPYARASVTGRISKHYSHRVTVNGTVYELQTRLWYELVSNGIKIYEYLGNLKYYVSDTSGVPGEIDNVPFLIISDLNNSGSIDVWTNTAGTYVIKIERVANTQKKLPNSLIYNDNYVPFEKANNGGTYNGFSIGVNELINTRGTLAIGYANKITGEFSRAIGDRNEITVSNGIACGNINTISEAGGVAIGYINKVTGNSAVAIGVDTIANGTDMVAVGRHNVPANTEFPNWENNTFYPKGSIFYAVYSPSPNIVPPKMLFVATVDYTSIATGTFYQDYQQYEIKPVTLLGVNSDTVFVVGNGKGKDSRSNALKLDPLGNEYIGGDLYVNCDPDSTNGTKVATVDQIPTVNVDDVQVNGTSVVQNGVATIPLADNNGGAGVVKLTAGSYGLSKANDGYIYVVKATDAMLKAGGTQSFADYRPIMTNQQHFSTFYGLAKAAGADEKNSTLAIGTYTDTAKGAIQKMLGMDGILGTDESDLTASKAYAVGDVFIANGKMYKVTTAIAADGAIVTEGAGQNAEEITVADDFVKKDDWATASNAGVVKISSLSNSNFGIAINANGYLYALQSSDSQIKAGTNFYRPIMPEKQHQSVFYGLAKAAGDTTQSQSDNAIGTYTDDAKTAIKTMLGVEDPAVDDVQINGRSIVSDGVAEIPKASTSNLGVVRTLSTLGVAINNDGELFLSCATPYMIKLGTNTQKAIAPSEQHYSTFYGLAKAAGDATQSASDNAVGVYTDSAKTAIKSMLGVVDPTVTDVQIDGTSVVSNGVAEIPVASPNTLGVVKVTNTYGLDIGAVGTQHENYIRIVPAPANRIKNGDGYYSPVTTNIQHSSTFYGLAKAAGDTTQSQSSNAVGTYTPEAKAAIKQMLGVSDLSTDITVSGTEPTITALANTRYLCGEVTSIDFTPSATGICEVIFTSGSAVALLTLPSTVKMPEWFDATALETDTIYDISIVDGVYGAVMTWQV